MVLVMIIGMVRSRFMVSARVVVRSRVMVSMVRSRTTVTVILIVKS